MALPYNYTVVPVRGTYLGLDGVPISGTVSFTATATRLVDSSALATIVGRTLRVPLGGNGSFVINLPATDDPDITPIDFNYKVVEEFVGGATYYINAPSSAASAGIDISTVAPQGDASAGDLQLVQRVSTLEAEVADLQANGGGGASVAEAWQFRPEDYGALRDGTTDDTSAVQSAITAAVSYAQNHAGHYAEVLLSPGTYKIAGPYQTANSAGNAQLTIPYNDRANPKITLAIKGPPAVGFMYWTEPTGPNYGAVLRSTGTGGDGTGANGPYTVLGGWRYDGVKFSNSLIVIDGLNIVVDNPANQMGIDLDGQASAWVKAASVMVDATPPESGNTGIDITVSSNPNATGLRMPRMMNNDVCYIDNYTAEGMYTALELTEHGVVNNMRCIYCNIGIRAVSTAHWVQIKSASLEQCGVMLDISDGFVEALQIDMEPQAGTYITSKYVVANAASRGVIRLGLNSGVQNNPETLMPASALPDLSASGAPLLRVYDMRLGTGWRTSDAPAVPASATALLNPFYRDAEVYVSGGTVSAISVDGTVTGLTGGRIHVPTGKSITLTYTVAPTWKWFLTGNTF